MKILYVHQYFATPRGSAGTRSYEIAKAMRADGHEVTILTSSAQLTADELPPGRRVERHGEIDGLPVIVLDVKYRQTMGHARRLLAFVQFMARASWVCIRVSDVDLIYATSTPLSVGACALLAKLVRNRPFAFEVRDLWPDVPIALGVIQNRTLARALKCFERLIYKNASFVVAANEDVKGEIRKQTTASNKPILVVPNACDVDLFRPNHDGTAFRREYSLIGKIVAVHAGTMGRVNGLDAIIDAAGKCRDIDDLQFILIGDGKERPRLTALARKLGLTNILFLDAMPKEELARVLATADIGLVTVIPVPIMELNCANKYFDYLASGLPIILNYRGWQANLLEDHECGLSAAQADSDGFAKHVRTLAGSAALREKFSRNARLLAETKLSRGMLVRPILTQLRSLSQRLAFEDALEPGTGGCEIVHV